MVIFVVLIGVRAYEWYFSKKDLLYFYRSLLQEVKSNPSHIKYIRINKTFRKRLKCLPLMLHPRINFLTRVHQSLSVWNFLDFLKRPILTTSLFQEKIIRILSAILAGLIPVVVLVIGGFFLFRFLQGGPGRGMSMGLRIKTPNPDASRRVTFADVAGIEEAKAEVYELVDFLKDPKRFTKLGGRIPKGVLLTGPPGTGKTLLAKAIAGEAGVPFFGSSGSEFDEMLVGLGASRVRDLFEQAKRSAPCIIFIDEIDAVGRQRGSRLRSSPGEEQTLNQLLVEMDGFDPNEGIIFIGATNRPDVLDKALLRPGRFDRHVMVSLPDVRGREQILQVHSKRVPLAKEVELMKIARGTPGFSGAELEALMNEAALLAARQGAEEVTMAHLEEAKSKVIMGPERKSLVISDAEKKITAYHESGHALVALPCERCRPGASCDHYSKRSHAGSDSFASIGRPFNHN